MSDENFLVVLEDGTFFVDVHNGREILTTSVRGRAARLTRDMANGYCQRLRLRGYRTARVEAVNASATTPEMDAEAERIARFWGVR